MVNKISCFTKEYRDPATETRKRCITLCNPVYSNSLSDCPILCPNYSEYYKQQMKK